MGTFAGWHLLVLALVTVVPIVLIGAIVFIVTRIGRSGRARSEERIAQRTADLLRARGPRRD